MMTSAPFKKVVNQTATQKRETPSSRADRAFESIRQTVTLNERLRESGIVSRSFILKKTSAR